MKPSLPALVIALAVLAPAARAGVLPGLPKEAMPQSAAAARPAVEALAASALPSAAAPLAPAGSVESGIPRPRSIEAAGASAGADETSRALGTLFDASNPGPGVLPDPDAAAPQEAPGDLGQRLRRVGEADSPRPPAPPGAAEKIATITKAFLEQPQPELSRTIAQAAVESPLDYRAALRYVLEMLLPGVPRLQRHLTVLDVDGDGKVSPREGYQTLREMSFGRVRAAIIAGGAQLALVASTGRVGWFSFAVNAGPRGLHRTVDSGAMDPEQDLDKKIDEFMAEDADRDGWIDMQDVGRLIDKRARMSRANRIATALVKAANKAEFRALFGLIGGRMNRGDLRDFYTGSLFFSLLTPDALARRIVGLRPRPEF